MMLLILHLLYKVLLLLHTFLYYQQLANKESTPVYYVLYSLVLTLTGFKHVNSKAWRRANAETHLQSAVNC